MSKWDEYLSFLDGSEYSVNVLKENLAPNEPVCSAEKVSIDNFGYSLWPFQQKILAKMEDSNLILGLPTGLGKTYLAGAYLKRESNGGRMRVLFLVPTIPLGVQQTLFARRMLNVEKACMVSGEITPDKRRKLMAWNNPFVISTPQTFANDFLHRTIQS